MKKIFTLIVALFCFVNVSAQNNVIEVNNLTISDDNFKDFTGLLGMFQVVGLGTDYQALFTVSSTQVVGSYKMEDMYPDYKPQIYVAAEEKVYVAEDADLTVTAIDGGYYFDGHVIAEGKTFHVTMSYAHKSEVIEVKVSEFSLTDLSMLGSQMVYMGSADGSAELMLLINCTALENGKTYTFADMDATSSLMGYNGSFLGIADGSTFVYTEQGDTKTYDATMVATTGDVLHFVYTESATGISDLKVTKTKAVKRIVDGQVIIEHNGKMYNLNGQIIN